MNSYFRIDGVMDRQTFIVATALPFFPLALWLVAIFVGRPDPVPTVQPISASLVHLPMLLPLALAWAVAVLINACAFVRRSRAIGKSVHWVWPFVGLWLLSTSP